MTKAGRNDPCTCGSGKKMKRCCGVTKIKKFEASIISSGSSKLSSLFNQQVSAVCLDVTQRASLANKVGSLKN